MKEKWREYFETEKEKVEFEERIISDENIIKAYIRTKNEKSLNYELNNKLLYGLEEYCLKNGEESKIINTVKNKLKSFFENYEYFEVNLILKIKSIVKRKYRPIVIMDIEDEICVNCFLNILLEELSEKVELSQRQFGNRTPLLKYKSIKKDDVEIDCKSDLYLERWQNSYNSYNKYLVEKLEKAEYVYITDIENFYPSISIERIFTKINKYTNLKWEKVYIRVFTMKITNISDYEEKISKEDLIRYGITINDEGHIMTSLPQGCIFSPIFANLYLIDMNELKLDFATYVDDIHIFLDKENVAKKVKELELYFKNNDLKMNTEKTTQLYEKETIKGYRKLITDYGSNVSILRAHTNKLDIDIENDKVILENATDIKKYLEQSVRTSKDDGKEIYNKYLEKINKTIKYRKERYYKYKSQSFCEYKSSLTNIERILNFLGNQSELLDDNVEQVETIMQELGTYNSKLYDIEEYIKKILRIYEKSNNIYLNNILFRYLNRNVDKEYEKFKQITDDKKSILYKEKFYRLRVLMQNKESEQIYISGEKINIQYLEKDTLSTEQKKEFLTKLFNEIKEKEIDNISIDNIYYKIFNASYNHEFFENDKEISAIINIGTIIPERSIINQITKIIQLALSNKSVYEMNVWEYRLYILSKSYQREKQKYIELVIANLEDEVNNQYKYIDSELIDIMENNFIPKLWKENVECVDGLLKLYLIVKRLWGQGSRNLYFYTLHNHEHANVLLTNFEKFIKSQIWKLSLSQTEILYVYITFILHDIGMLWIESTEILNKDEQTLKKIIEEYYLALKHENIECYKEICKKRSKAILSKHREVLKVSPVILQQSEETIEIKASEIEIIYTSEIETFTRDLHGLLSVKLIQNDTLGITKIIKKMKLDINIIYSLIFGHAELGKNIVFKEYEGVDIVKLNKIIQLIDVTDVTNSRVNSEFYKTFEKEIPLASKKAYDKHLNVTDFNIETSDENQEVLFRIECVNAETEINPLEKQVENFNKYLTEKQIDLKIKIEKE